MSERPVIINKEVIVDAICGCSVPLKLIHQFENQGIIDYTGDQWFSSCVFNKKKLMSLPEPSVHLIYEAVKEGGKLDSNSKQD